MKGAIEIVGEVGVIKLPSDTEITTDSKEGCQLSLPAIKLKKIGDARLFYIALIGQGDD